MATMPLPKRISASTESRRKTFTPLWAWVSFIRTPDRRPGPRCTGHSGHRPDASQQFVSEHHNTAPFPRSPASTSPSRQQRCRRGGGRGRQTAHAAGRIAGAHVAAMMGRPRPSAVVEASAPGVRHRQCFVLSEGDANIVTRFRILRSLRDEGLITARNMRRAAKPIWCAPAADVTPPAAGWIVGAQQRTGGGTTAGHWKGARNAGDDDQPACRGARHHP
jgi:hypothetical protein